MRRRRCVPVLGCGELRDRCPGAGRRWPGHGPLNVYRSACRLISPTFDTGDRRRELTMERADALATIQDVAAEVLSVEPTRVTEAARFKEDLDADSLDLVELVMGLEERFDIEVPEDDLEGVTTVGHAVDLVLTKVGS